MASNASAALVLLLCIASSLAFDAFEDVISDITSSSADDGRAMELKSDQFWKPVLKAAQGVKRAEHLAIYAEVESAIAGLPAENAYVRDLLSESLERLRRADERVFLQAVQSAELASEKLAVQGEADGTFSFLTGGQNFISQAIQLFTGEGRYSDRLAKHIARRQSDVLPVLRGASSVTSDVLGDCRLAVKLGFDVLKYDIYNSGVPKTPPDAKAAANKLVDAGGETRHNFMQGIMATVESITRDTTEKHANPSALVSGALMSSLEDSLTDESVEDLERIPVLGPIGKGKGLISFF